MTADFPIRREAYADKFNLSSSMRQKMTIAQIHQLDACKDDDARRLILKFMPGRKCKGRSAQDVEKLMGLAGRVRG